MRGDPAFDSDPQRNIFRNGGESVAVHPSSTRNFAPATIIPEFRRASRNPGDEHIWHVDMESADPDGRFVTVWVGLENTTADSGLRLVAGSHLCGKTVQQFEAERGAKRADISTETVLEWAKSANPDAYIAEPAVSDGEAILFDGRLCSLVWHTGATARVRPRHPSARRRGIIYDNAT